MIVVELEALNEGAVEERRGRRRGLAVPADDAACTRTFKPGDDLHGFARPRQPRADNGAADTVEQEILRPLAHAFRHVIERQILQPGGKPPGLPVGVGRRAASHRRVDHRSSFGQRAALCWLVQACGQQVDSLSRPWLSPPQYSYAPGNRGLWQKSKCLQREEFIIVGYTEPEGSRPYLGALLLGYYDTRGASSMPGALRDR